ncbi:MAG: SHOCT domain-containing protein [Oenococcus oeni]
MKIENKIILRRLISGILLLLMSIFCLYESFEVDTFGQKLDIDKMVTAGGAGYLIAISSFIIGLIFVFTARIRPTKWIEYGIAAVVVFIFFIESTIDIGKFFFDLHLFRWGMLILVVLGLPEKKSGFKDMPFAKKENKTISEHKPKVETKKSASKPDKDIKAENNNDLSQLVELKKLLDSGVITKKEFKAKKKQILGL